MRRNCLHMLIILFWNAPVFCINFIDCNMLPKLLMIFNIDVLRTRAHYVYCSADANNMILYLLIFSVIPGLTSQSVSAISALPSTPQSPAAPINGLSLLQTAPATATAPEAVIPQASYPVGDSQLNFIPALVTDHAAGHAAGKLVIILLNKFVISATVSLFPTTAIIDFNNLHFLILWYLHFKVHPLFFLRLDKGLLTAELWPSLHCFPQPFLLYFCGSTEYGFSICELSTGAFFKLQAMSAN